MMETALLQAFLAFAETRNFTRAAKQLGLSQPAVFERVQKLSEQLNCTLYVREGRELSLTAAGLRVLALARDIERRFEQFETEAAGPDAHTVVTLAAGEGSYLYLLGPALRAFSRSSKAALNLLTTGARATLEALRSGAAELGVAALDMVPRGIEATTLRTAPLCVALPEGHPLLQKARLRVADLAKERLILTPDGQLHRDLVVRAVGDSHHHHAPPLEADGWPLMLAFVQMGLGVAIVNQSCILPEGVVVRPMSELGSVTYRLLKRRSATLSLDAQALSETIVAYCKRRQ